MCRWCKTMVARLRACSTSSSSIQHQHQQQCSRCTAALQAPMCELCMAEYELCTGTTYTGKQHCKPLDHMTLVQPLHMCNTNRATMAATLAVWPKQRKLYRRAWQSECHLCEVLHCIIPFNQAADVRCYVHTLCALCECVTLCHAYQKLWQCCRH